MGNVVSSIFGSGTDKSNNQSQTQAPWEPQQPYLTWGFNQAQNATQNALNNPVYQGKRVSDLNPFQISSANNAGTFSNNGWGYANNGMNVGNGLMNTGSAFGGNAANLFNQYSDPNGAMKLGNAFANSQYANGLIDAASRDVNRNLYENQLPTLAKAAAGSGNTNSTRAGVESAIAQRGAADRLADVSAGIRGQLFNQGQNQYNTNLQNSLAANSQLANAYNSGIYGMNNGANLGNNLFNLGQNAGQMFQNQNQNELNADMQKFNEQNNNSLDLMKKYMQLVTGNYGGTTISSGSSNETKTPSIASIIGSFLKG